MNVTRTLIFALAVALLALDAISLVVFPPMDVTHWVFLVVGVALVAALAWLTRPRRTDTVQA